MRTLAAAVIALAIVGTLAGCAEQPLPDTQATILMQEDSGILSSLHATLATESTRPSVDGVGGYAAEHALMVPALTPGTCANSIWPLILLDRDASDTSSELQTGQDVVIGGRHVTQLVRTFSTVQKASDFLTASETELAACHKYTVAAKTHIAQKVTLASDTGYSIDTVSTSAGEKTLTTHRLVFRDANVIVSVSGTSGAPVAAVAKAIQKRITG